MTTMTMTGGRLQWPPADLRDLDRAVGSTMLMRTDGSLHVPVQILDSRQVWNRLDALIRPVGGSGERWVDADRLSERKDADPYDLDED